jgi:hypothetical protein
MALALIEAAPQRPTTGHRIHPHHSASPTTIVNYDDCEASFGPQGECPLTIAEDMAWHICELTKEHAGSHTCECGATG